MHLLGKIFQTIGRLIVLDGDRFRGERTRVLYGVTQPAGGRCDQFVLRLLGQENGPEMVALLSILDQCRGLCSCASATAINLLDPTALVDDAQCRAVSMRDDCHR